MPWADIWPAELLGEIINAGVQYMTSFPRAMCWVSETATDPTDRAGARIYICISTACVLMRGYGHFRLTN